MDFFSFHEFITDSNNWILDVFRALDSKIPIPFLALSRVLRPWAGSKSCRLSDLQVGQRQSIAIVLAMFRDLAMVHRNFLTQENLTKNNLDPNIST